MAFYQLKNRVVDAMQWDGSIQCADEIDKWTHYICHIKVGTTDDFGINIYVPNAWTNEPAIMDPGDYIVQKQDGDYVVFTESAFNNIYEKL